MYSTLINYFFYYYFVVVGLLVYERVSAFTFPFPASVAALGESEARTRTLCQDRELFFDAFSNADKVMKVAQLSKQTHLAKAGKGPLLDTREQTQNPESNGYEKHNTDIADGNSVNDASVADGAGCKAPSLKKTKKTKKNKKKSTKTSNGDSNDNAVGTTKMAPTIVNQSLDKASDRLVVLKNKPLEIQNLLETHTKAADEIQHLDTLKETTKEAL